MNELNFLLTEDRRNQLIREAEAHRLAREARKSAVETRRSEAKQSENTTTKQTPEPRLRRRFAE